MESVNDPVTAAALSSAITALLVWVSGKGWPVIKEALGWMSDKEKQIREQAKEGPIMVLEEVKRQLAETKLQSAVDKADYAKQLSEVLLELKDFRKAHHDCETKYAGLQSEVQFLRRELAEIKEENK